MKTKNKVKIAPSLLSVDYSCLADQIRQAESGGADMFHFDVMDGHFVPNLSFGPHIFKCIRKLTDLRLDVHLMVENPIDFLEAFKEAGADSIFFHPEVTASIPRMIRRIRNFDLLVGLVLNPETSIHFVTDHLDAVDIILVMSVQPGFGGQDFMPESLEKISELRQIIDKNEYITELMIDGGINIATAPLAIEAGVDILVAGSSVFESGDIPHAIQHLRGIS